MAKRSRKNLRASGFSPIANPEMHQAMMELRRSSAAQRHTLARHKGTRSAQARKALSDWR